ncbi:MAG: MaoC family dehydratase [Dysosmobacter sp.]
MSYSVDQLQAGQTASFSKTITEHDVYTFAGVTGNLNPAHINEPFARQTQFHGRIAHGMLSAGLIAVIGMHLPGPGTIYLGQELSFRSPVRIGDTITATVTVRSLNPERNRAELDTVCTNQDGVQVVTGTAKVMPPKV